MLIEKRPQAVGIMNPAIAQVLDDPAPEQLIWEDSGTINTEQVDTGSGDRQIIHVKADLRSMRKLKPGDTTVLSHIANTASSFIMAGTITQFFKQ